MNNFPAETTILANERDTLRQIDPYDPRIKDLNFKIQELVDQHNRMIPFDLKTYYLIVLKTFEGLLLPTCTHHLSIANHQHGLCEVHSTTTALNVINAKQSSIIRTILR